MHAGLARPPTDIPTLTMFKPLLDTLLDRTVVAGYTGAVYRIRSEMWNPVVDLCDMSDLGAVRRFASGFNAEAERLDVLVNSAGVLLNERTLSVDGIELTFATNVLGPFRLTNLLLSLLERSAPARVTNVSHAPGLGGHPGHPVLTSAVLSTRRPDGCCARRRRARTRSSGLAPRPSRHAARASSGMTADGGRSTACPGPRRPPRTARDGGPNASASAACTPLGLRPPPLSHHQGGPNGALPRNR